ncbi:MAG: RNA-binding protein [Saprospirales bacterium]|nr:RNA-binding protein [Saprospirales bacterium]MBK8489696.1 RNA-binding protein [Saprospirales bacterium]
MNIFVAKLSFDTRSEDLKEAFEAYGEVSSANVIHDKFTGRSKGFGFVEMDNDEDAKKAIEGLNETELDGRTIVVKKAEPRADRGDSNRGGGGGGGGRRW